MADTRTNIKTSRFIFIGVNLTSRFHLFNRDKGRSTEIMIFVSSMERLRSDTRHTYRRASSHAVTSIIADNPFGYPRTSYVQFKATSESTTHAPNKFILSQRLFLDIWMPFSDTQYRSPKGKPRSSRMTIQRLPALSAYSLFKLLIRLEDIHLLSATKYRHSLSAPLIVAVIFPAQVRHTPFPQTTFLTRLMRSTSTTQTHTPTMPTSNRKTTRNIFNCLALLFIVPKMDLLAFFTKSPIILNYNILNCGG